MCACVRVSACVRACAHACVYVCACVRVYREGGGGSKGMCVQASHICVCARVCVSVRARVYACQKSKIDKQEEDAV